MAGEIDIFLLEQKTGKDFASRIKRNLLSSIKSKTKKGSGQSMKTSVRPVFKNGMLDRLTIFTPYYIYPILHVGFEGSKKRGFNYRVEAKNFITDALESGKLVEDLASIVGEQRATDIMTRINIGFDKNTNTSNSKGNE